MTEPPFDTGQLTGAEVLQVLTGSDVDLTPPRWFRVSRPCYDKLRRCPGWAGGGTRYARVQRCEGGYLKTYDDNGMVFAWQWRFYRCPKCHVIVLPYMVRWLDWRYVWFWKVCDIPKNLAYWWRTNFSWWDEETGHWQAWAGPHEILIRLPEVMHRELRYRFAVLKIRMGIYKK